MESNTRDPYTLIELAVLALYGQAITYPYMRCAWKARTNILTLDPLHSKLLAHLDSSFLPRSSVWARSIVQDWSTRQPAVGAPEVIYAILAMECRLPHLRGALVAFLEGALETWIRFTAEFTSKDGIASLSAGEQDSAAMLSTDDANEGTLGADARCLAGTPEDAEKDPSNPSNGTGTGTRQRGGPVPFPSRQRKAPSSKRTGADPAVPVRRPVDDGHGLEP
ncbi:hypothetical protein B0H14DRAFT_3423369 [Mycena olivaceomarginata]|nr:hypothetical protein B0H14DRAFT_3423369 [Mycena olivaceomarginata]